MWIGLECLQYMHIEMQYVTLVQRSLPIHPWSQENERTTAVQELWTSRLMHLLQNCNSCFSFNVHTWNYQIHCDVSVICQTDQIMFACGNMLAECIRLKGLGFKSHCCSRVQVSDMLLNSMLPPATQLQWISGLQTQVWINSCRLPKMATAREGKWSPDYPT